MGHAAPVMIWASWAPVGRQTEAMAKLMPPLIEAVPTQIATVAA